MRTLTALALAIASALAIGALAACKTDTYKVYTGQQDAGIDAAPCGLVTCESEHASCGPIGDGCGLTLSCGSCTAPADVCGGDGSAFTCGSDHCVPRTCHAANAECGVVADGCGGVTDSCGTCPTGTICGAGGIANVCATPPCDGLCAQQMTCAGSGSGSATVHTTIHGTVTAPGHDDVAAWGPPDPIYGALVYIPNGSNGAPRYGVEAFPAGVSCDSCTSLVTGSPLVSTTTGVDGTFTLVDAPCGTSIPLVMQLGRWRRQITIPAVACCADTELAAAQTHLPRTRLGEPGDLRSDIPLIAVATGDVDAMHCVLRKTGIADSEFTDPTGPGRVHFYRDDGAKLGSATPAATALYDHATEWDRYDLALLECVGDREPKTLAEQANLIAFANAGGRVFATHYSYVWLTDSDGTTGTNTGPKPFSQTASWLVDQDGSDRATATVDQTLQGDAATQARRVAFASWLIQVGASTTLGTLAVNVVRHDFDAVSPTPATASDTPAQRWLYTTGSPFTAPLHYTFDTPLAYPPAARPTKECGRVVYSDFHVSDALTDGSVFPAECSDGPMTPQEKALEFMLFDLASCIGPPASACTPKTCEDQGVACGETGDGCDDGVVLHCGDCYNGQTCGGGGLSMCGYGLCEARTCASVGAMCGTIGNGCGGIVDCGLCAAGLACGVDGTPNQCSAVIK